LLLVVRDIHEYLNWYKNQFDSLQLVFSLLWWSYLVRYFIFFQLRLSMEHLERVNINPPPRDEACFCFELRRKWGPHTGTRAPLWPGFEPRLSRLQAKLSTTKLSRYPSSATIMLSCFLLAQPLTTSWAEFSVLYTLMPYVSSCLAHVS